MSNQVMASQVGQPATPRSVDLDATEQTIRQVSGSDLTEAKEAIVEGLLQLAIQRCTGEGEEGEFVFGGSAFEAEFDNVPLVIFVFASGKIDDVLIDN